jgi:hypothetical protein
VGGCPALSVRQRREDWDQALTGSSYLWLLSSLTQAEPVERQDLLLEPRQTHLGVYSGLWRLIYRCCQVASSAEYDRMLSGSRLFFFLLEWA